MSIGINFYSLLGLGREELCHLKFSVVDPGFQKGGVQKKISCTSLHDKMTTI